MSPGGPGPGRHDRAPAGHEHQAEETSAARRHGELAALVQAGRLAGASLEDEERVLEEMADLWWEMTDHEQEMAAARVV